MGLDSKPPRDTAAPERDVVLLGGKTDDGHGVHVLRARRESIETGELRPLREGQPIVGELVSLRPRKDDPRVCDVTSSFKAPEAKTATATATAESKKGPAQVATATYREHYDAIFGAKRELPN